MLRRIGASLAGATAMLAAAVYAQEFSMSSAIVQKFAEQEQYYQLPSGVLSKIARIESGGNAAALNSSTQAGGLFQWIPRYWYESAQKLYMQQGKQCDGGCNPQSRFNPFIATEITAYNLAYVRTVIQPKVQAARADLTVGLYMGHFLGAAGAGKFFVALAQVPNANAAQYFPKEAQYNSSVFSGRTIAGVYNFFAQKMQAPGISGVSNYAGNYSGPLVGRMMDPAGNAMLVQPYTMVPPPAPYHSYPTSYDLQQDTSYVNQPLTVPPSSGSGGTQSGDQSATSGASVEPAAIIIVQSSKVQAGNSIIVSWASVGMTSCSVKLRGNEMERGTQGTIYGANASVALSPMKYDLECAARNGATVARSVNVTIQ